MSIRRSPAGGAGLERGSLGDASGTQRAGIHSEPQAAWRRRRDHS